jgi:ribosomal protein S18 acetylase RimI-like enzyme
MQLRPLDENDAEAFWRLRLRGFKEEPESFGTSYEEATERPLEDVARELRREGERADDVVIGAFAPELVGHAGLLRERRKKRHHRATLWGMYVAREARGQGVGRALVAEIVRHARLLDGLEQIALTVIAENAQACRLYESLGFRVYGHSTRALHVGERFLDEKLMLLDLRS